MSAPETAGAPEAVLSQNRAFYDAIWSASYVVSPERFNTWPVLSAFAASARRRLEVGPGLRPRLPIRGTRFVDVSAPALSRLRALGGVPTLASVTALPFPDASFELVGAFDVVEHVDEDRPVFRELARVAGDGAKVVLSVPLHAARWTAFDVLVGHVRRYDPGELLSLLEAHDLVVEESAAFGMAPRSRWLLDLAVWSLERWRGRAMHWYNRVFLPIGLRMQRRLGWKPGLLDVADVDEVLLVCRRRSRGRTHRAVRSGSSIGPVMREGAP